jgi:hypothetical protein
MASNAMQRAVNQLVSDWLEKRAELLKGVCDEVAGELGPMIATEITRGLAEVLTPTDKDREMIKLKSAALHVAEWLERAKPQMSSNIWRAAAHMQFLLHDAVGSDIPFNLPPVEDQPEASDDLPEQQLDGGDQP